MKRFIILLAMLIVSMIIRMFFWIFGYSSYTNWSIYDVGYYVDSGEKLIVSLLSFNLDVVKSYLFHPLLGYYTTGFTSILFRVFLDKYSAGLLSPILFSSLMCLIVYLIGEKIGGFKMGFIAWLLATFDPYSIQFSTTFLDMPATFFTALFFYLLVKYSSNENLKKYLLMGVAGGLAISSKHIVIPTILLLTIFFTKKAKNILLIIAVAILTYVTVNIVKFTSLENLSLILSSNIEGGGIGIPAIIYGPIEIGKPYTYPWYILTYLGLGYTGIGVAPYITPVITFILFCYYRISKKLKVLNVKKENYSRTIMWVACSLIPLILLPRNYWIPLSRFPGISSESNILTKFFYPYYYVITIAALSIFMAYLVIKEPKLDNQVLKNVSTRYIDRVLLSVSHIIVVLFLLLSPLGLAANTIYPFWDFIFTLIINIEKEEPIIKTMGAQLLILTALLLVGILTIALVAEDKKGDSVYRVVN